MKMIVGLGNPGEKYEATRHNVGFILLDLLGDYFNVELKEQNFGGITAEVFHKGQKLILVKPQTYMNLSGQCVGEIARYYKIDNEDIFVIADDLSLPVGTMKLRPKGSSGGHNGLKSLIAHLDGDDFPRLKVGIGGSGGGGDVVINHVLGHFPLAEWEKITEIMELAKDCTLDWLHNGVDDAMCHYNIYSKLKKPKEEKAEVAESEQSKEKDKPKALKPLASALEKD